MNKSMQGVLQGYTGCTVTQEYTEGAYGGTQFFVQMSVNFYVFGQLSVNY